MNDDTKEALLGIATLAAVAAAMVCGLGLFFLGLGGNISQTDFVRLGMSTLGAAMLGAVLGFFFVAKLQSDRVKEKAEPDRVEAPPERVPTADDRPAQA